VLEVEMRFSSRDEAAFLYRMDHTGTIEMAKAFAHDTLPIEAPGTRVVVAVSLILNCAFTAERRLSAGTMRLLPNTVMTRSVTIAPTTITDSAEMAIRLRRVEAGLYELPDGSYGVVRVESCDEFDAVSSDGWAIVRGGAKDGIELPGSYRTKADAVEALEEMLK
jgi:hypothetical protein